MSIGPNQPLPFQETGAPMNFGPSGQYNYPTGQSFTQAPQVNPPAFHPVATQGVASMVGFNLRCLDEIAALAGRALEGAQGAEIRQTLWQIQQLAGQAKAYAFQIRGMLLQ